MPEETEQPVVAADPPPKPVDERLKRYILKQRKLKKEAEAQHSLLQEQHRQRSERHKQHTLTLEQTKEQIADLEKRLTGLRSEKHQLFTELKKVLNKDQKKPDGEPPGPSLMDVKPKMEPLKRSHSPAVPTPPQGLPSSYFHPHQRAQDQKIFPTYAPTHPGSLYGSYSTLVANLNSQTARAITESQMLSHAAAAAAAGSSKSVGGLLSKYGTVAANAGPPDAKKQAYDLSKQQTMSMLSGIPMLPGREASAGLPFAYQLDKRLHASQPRTHGSFIPRTPYDPFF